MRGIELPCTSRKWVIVHGHFYQPPRENPWLDIIETQPSAAPFHDWNERIYAECYRPNGFSRLLDPDGMITGINNNYASMSFNFGPTLMEWIEKHHPATTRRIVEGDQQSAIKNGGHGNAIAQVYNHIIMPLASRRDQLTQIRWAKASFRRSFGRDPEGLWLAETAINMETVRCLIKEKIAFVVLAPQQAESYRSIDASSGWVSTGDRTIDTRRPYRLYVRNSNGKKEGGFIDVFFFDEPLSKEISFNDLLQDARTLGRRIDACYSPDAKENELAIIATDGETFGHHKPFGDMCLAYFFTHVAPALGIQPVNFGQYLALHPPQYEFSLKNAFGEGTAWSCAHGVGRWIRDCGCETGGKPQWNQAWRSPLREALDTLQDEVDEIFIAACNEAGLEPWALRDDFHRASHDTTPKQWERFLQARCDGRALTRSQSQRLHRLCEAQKYMLYSFTSCGWFFADISGIEPLQNLAYASRALQLGITPERQPAALERFLRILSAAKSNLNNDTGATLFEKNIRPFINHERMIGFTLALENALGIATGNKSKRYGYLGRVETHDVTQPSRRSSGFRIYDVHLGHGIRGEESTWLVVIELVDDAEPAGWVLPGNTDIDVSSLSRKTLEDNAQATYYTPADIFYTLRSDLSSVFLRKIARHSGRQFESWFNSNREDLSILHSFHSDIPGYFRGPLLFIFQQKWDNAISRLANSGTEKNGLQELEIEFGQAQHLDLTLQLSKSAEFCEELICKELARFAENCLDAVRCDRIIYLMDVVDRFSLPVSKHRLEDMFFPLLSGPVKKLYMEFVAAGTEAASENSSEKQELLLKILNFARRMNFSIHEFPLP